MSLVVSRTVLSRTVTLTLQVRGGVRAARALAGRAFGAAARRDVLPAVGRHLGQHAAPGPARHARHLPGHRRRRLLGHG